MDSNDVFVVLDELHQNASNDMNFDVALDLLAEMRFDGQHRLTRYTNRHEQWVLKNLLQERGLIRTCDETQLPQLLHVSAYDEWMDIMNPPDPDKDND